MATVLALPGASTKRGKYNIINNNESKSERSSIIIHEMDLAKDYSLDLDQVPTCLAQQQPPTSPATKGKSKKKRKASKKHGRLRRLELTQHPAAALSTPSTNQQSTTSPPSPQIDSFSTEILLRIFGFLDWKSVSMVQCSCYRWWSVCQRSRGDELLEQKGVSNILWLFYLLDKIDGQIGIVMRMEEQEEQMRLKEGQKGEDGPNDAEKEKNKKKKKKKKSKKANSNKAKQKEQKKEKQEQFDMYQRGGTRIEFLKATVMLLRTYFKQNGLLQEPKVVPMREYTKLLGILDKQLLETHFVLEQVISGQIYMNENFDIIELSLRRYYSDFMLMFSPLGEANQAYSRPSLIITDDKARKVWEKNVGKHVYFCSFKAFYKEVLRKETNLEDKEFKRYMKYFLNFPKDDTVSVTKWNTLTRLFGPYRNFYRTLHRYVMGTGFLGLINRIRAEEILKDYPDHVLIRFSRTAPLLLAFSENKDGAITHSTNGANARKLLGLPETKENVPIDLYLQKVFPRSSLVPMKVNGRLVAKKDNYRDYVSRPAGYICAGQFLWEN